MTHIKMTRPVGRWMIVALLALTSGACAAGAGKGDDEGGDGDGGSDGAGASGAGAGSGIGDPIGSTGEQAGLEEVRATCETSKVGKPALRRLTQGEVEWTLREIFPLLDTLGYAGVKLSPDPLSKVGFTNDASVLVVGGTTAKEMLKTAEDVAGLVSSQLESLLPCAATSADEACVTEFVNQYGLRLFRRPVKETELARYVDYQASVAGRSDFATGMKWMLTAMLQSPYAFYRSEVGTPSGARRQLDDYELATQLSYMLVGTTPDQALLDRASAGQLADPVVRRQEAERLLTEHPRRREGLRTFFNEWLKYRTVLGQSRDSDPTFADEISPRMVSETRFFLDTLVLGDKGTVHDLMTANYTALDEQLSTFYGYGGIAGAEFQRATRPPEHGMGILAQGSLLVSTSHQAATSPTLRGLLVTERFLCTDAPPVPAVVPTIESTNEGKPAATTREKYEVNHGEPGSVCAECHLNFEPFGYTFEGFDELGRMRTMEDGVAVNTVVTNAPLPDGSKGSFNNLDEVAQLVNTTSDIQNCVSGLMAAYMFSGAGGTECLAEEARAKVAAGEMSIYDYLLALTEAPHFSSRE